MDTHYVNIFVACSNFTLLFSMYHFDILDRLNLWIAYPMMASIIYHLSETKHGLPGIYPLNKYSYELIWLDRIGAVGSAIFVMLQIWSQKIDNILTFLFLGISGFICLGISEYDVLIKTFNRHSIIRVNKNIFLISHSLWHICAFHLLAYTLALKS